MKIPLRSPAFLNIENGYKFCFIWSILASVQPCENSHPKKASNYRRTNDELNIEAFDFSNGFKCSDVHRFEKLNGLSIKKFELSFYRAKKMEK